MPDRPNYIPQRKGTDAKREQATKTYVFLGEDYKGNTAIEEALSAYKKRTDCIVITPIDGEDFRDAIKRANIGKNANIILLAHGSELGTFTWNSGEKKINFYFMLFYSLPKDTQSITLGGCFSGIAVKDLYYLPKGTLLLSATSAIAASSTGQAIPFARETNNLLKPVDFYLEALDNFNPAAYQDFAESCNKRNKNAEKLDTNPLHALPQILGIGGSPVIEINLNQEMVDVRNKIKNKTINTDAWNRALTRVRERFDTKGVYGTDNFYDNNDGAGNIAELIIDQKVVRIWEKLSNGEPLKSTKTIEGVDEKRIALALTAAYLDESGKIDQLVKKGKAPTPSYIKQLESRIPQLEKLGWASRIGNGDAEITVEEISATFARHNIFINVDKNHDNHLTGREITDFLKTLPVIKSKPSGRGHN